MGLLRPLPGRLTVPAMCTYETQIVPMSGSAKGPAGWFPLASATVYFDHPVHAPAEHTLNVDFVNADLGPGSRVAVELDPASARKLAEAIITTLDRSAALASSTSSGLV